jgi:Domain of unknown function (DUF5916)
MFCSPRSRARGRFEPALHWMRRHIARFVVVFVAAFAVPATAQEIRAYAVDIDTAESPTDDAVWSLSESQALVQRAPRPNQPTDFETRMQFLASRTHVYLRVVCADRQPQRAVAHSLVFDGDQSFDDHITIVLDTFQRHRTAYEFDVNSAGSRTDGLLSPAATLTNYDWNGDWRARVVPMDGGWIVYIAIDTRSLQFPSGGARWGFNVARYVPREQLSLQWSGISLDASISDLSRMGSLVGVDRQASSANWQFSPYALTRYSNSGQGAAQGGFDVRYQFGPEMAASLTVNPDFAEAEVDAQQINLTPYALFKPEKRQFFLDGSNQFTFASGIGSIFVPFYSRTIGLLDATSIRIDEGMKAVGQIGPLSIGALGVRSGNSPVSEATNLFVGRVAYDVDDKLRIGALVTDGDPSGQSKNRFEGIDAVWRTATLMGDKNLNISAWAARSSGGALPGQHAGWGTYIDYPNDRWRWVISANEFGDALNPALGFLPRPGTRQYDAYLGHFPRPTSENLRWVHQFFYELELEQVDDLHGTTESRKLTVTPFNIITDSSAHFEWHWASHFESLFQPFVITDGVKPLFGDYHFQRVHFQAESSTARAFQAGAQLEVGGFYDGTLTQAIPYLRWTTPGGKWRFEFNNETDWASLHEGGFVQRLYQLKASYSFDNDLAFSSFTQFDTDTNHIGTNAQLRWIIAPGRDVFFIFNHGVAPSLADAQSWRAPIDNSVTLKLQWNFYL